MHFHHFLPPDQNWISIDGNIRISVRTRATDCKCTLNSELILTLSPDMKYIFVSVLWPNNIVIPGTWAINAVHMLGAKIHSLRLLFACLDRSIWGQNWVIMRKLMRNIKWWWEDFPLSSRRFAVNYWLWGKLWGVSCLAALHNNLAQKSFERVHIKTCSGRRFSILCKVSIESSKTV